jgi:hypothetical protein
MNGGIEKIYTMPYLNSVIVCLLPTTLLIYNYVLVLQISHTLLLPEMLLVPPVIRLCLNTVRWRRVVLFTSNRILGSLLNASKHGLLILDVLYMWTGNSTAS